MVARANDGHPAWLSAMLPYMSHDAQKKTLVLAGLARFRRVFWRVVRIGPWFFVGSLRPQPFKQGTSNDQRPFASFRARAFVSVSPALRKKTGCGVSFVWPRWSDGASTPSRVWLKTAIGKAPAGEFLSFRPGRLPVSPPHAERHRRGSRAGPTPPGRASRSRGAAPSRGRSVRWDPVMLIFSMISLVIALVAGYGACGDAKAPRTPADAAKGISISARGLRVNADASRSARRYLAATRRP